MVERIRGRIWQRLRFRVLHEQPICYACKERASVEVDHIKPLHKGGTNDRANLGGICTDCHRDKSAREQAQTRKVAIGLDGWPIAE